MPLVNVNCSGRSRCLIAVTEIFAALIVAHRCDVTWVSLVHFTLLGRSIRQLLCLESRFGHILVA